MGSLQGHGREYIFRKEIQLSDKKIVAVGTIKAGKII